MKKIGITGGIGSGKTIVSKVFVLLGIPIYDSDTWAKKLMNEDEQLIQELKNTFGNDIYTPQNQLIPEKLAQKVFDNTQKLKQLNNLVHPKVRQHFEQWTTNQDQNLPYVIQESALIFENDLQKKLFKTILVLASINTRIKRIKKRNPQLTETQIQNIINKQIEPQKAIQLADFIIQNDDTELLLPQILAIHNQLSAL